MKPQFGLDYLWALFWKTAREFIDKEVEISCYGKLLLGLVAGGQSGGGRQLRAFRSTPLASLKLVGREKGRENRNCSYCVNS